MAIIDVKDNGSLREAYKALDTLKKMEHNHELDDHNLTLLRDIIIDEKREIRKYFHKNHRERMVVWAGIVECRMAWSYGIDGYVELITFPDGYTLRETESLFERYFKIDYHPTYYDCTGQAFTSWHKTFQRNGRYCIYHSVGIDI